MLLATLTHSGILGNDPTVLAPPQSYTGNTTVTLPSDITGQYYITAWADSLDAVLKSERNANINPDDPNTLNNDNFKATPITLLQTPPPDLVVTSIVAPTTAVGGDSYNVQWTVQNQGGSDTEDSVLFDKVYVSNEPTLNASGATQFLLGTVEHDGVVAAGGSYTAQQTFNLSPEVTGQYVIVEANTGNIIITNDTIEYISPTYVGSYTNNVADVAATINRLPPANLQVTAVTGQSVAYSGQPDHGRLDGREFRRHGVVRHSVLGRNVYSRNTRRSTRTATRCLATLRTAMPRPSVRCKAHGDVQRSPCPTASAARRPVRKRSISMSSPSDGHDEERFCGQTTTA